MEINPESDSPLPVGEQIQAQIRLLIHSDVLTADTLLPTVKELAASLKLNYNTVAAAYRALERAGYLVQNRRAGTRVAPNPPKAIRETLSSYLSASFAAQLTANGLDVNEALHQVAAHAAQQATSSPLKVAVLGRSPIEAAQAAERSQAVLGDGFRCIPMTPSSYTSLEYHLTLIDPPLAPALRSSANVIPREVGPGYSSDFPAGAD